MWGAARLLVRRGCRRAGGCQLLPCTALISLAGLDNRWLIAPSLAPHCQAAEPPCGTLETTMLPALAPARLPTARPAGGAASSAQPPTLRPTNTAPTHPAAARGSCICLFASLQMFVCI
jgi:hypothetical protein